MLFYVVSEIKKPGELTTPEAVIETAMKDYIHYQLPSVDEVKKKNARNELQDAKLELAELHAKLDSATKSNTEIQNKYTDQQKE